MLRLKNVIEGKSKWEHLIDGISLIENNRFSNPNVALDGAKTIVETVSKTILGDFGIKFESSINFDSVVKKAFQTLWVFNRLEKTDIEKAKSIAGSFGNIAKTIGELRNHYGFYSHGQDLENEKFNSYLSELCISSADTLASFLIFAHSESLKNKTRITYDENPEFNNWIDSESEDLEVLKYSIIPSKALFTDIEAYKENLLDFIDKKETLIVKLKSSNSFVNTREICRQLYVYQKYFTKNEVRELFFAAKKNSDIYKILGHGHTKNLFTHIKKDYANSFNEEEISDFEKLFQNAIW